MAAPPIKIIFGVDGSYSQHLAVTLVSLLENNRGNTFDILVVTLNMTVQDKARLRSVVDGFANVRLRFKDFDISRYSHFRTDGHISHASYLRIFIPEILAESEERILYLDCDLVVQEDIKPLWDFDLGDKVIAAAPNPFFVRHGDLDLPSDADYFNAGVLLINLRRWREANGTARLIRFIEAHHAHLYAHDQDALNAVFLGEFAELAPQWNFQTSMLWCEPEALSLRYEEFRHLVDDPAIIHYTTPSKPWHFGNTHPHKSIYYHYLMKTPYRDYKPADVSVASVVGRALRWPQVAFRDQLPSAYYPTRRAFRHLKTSYLGLKV